MRLLTLITLAFLCLNFADAQTLGPPPPPKPYPHLREGNVMFLRRVWRQIDLRQKKNHMFYFPTTPIVDRKSLWEVIVDGVKEGAITAYELGPTLDDEFLYPMSSKQAETVIRSIDSVWTTDIDTGEDTLILVESNVTSDQIVSYDIKEEWFFDRERSEMDVRIIGIAPNILKKNPQGEVQGMKTLFWIYYPEAMYTFSQHRAFNRHNDAERRSFYELLLKRQFASVITKRSNVYDRFIAEYKMGLNALLEAESIKDELRYMEHDVWKF